MKVNNSTQCKNEQLTFGQVMIFNNKYSVNAQRYVEKPKEQLKILTNILDTCDFNSFETYNFSFGKFKYCVNPQGDEIHAKYVETPHNGDIWQLHIPFKDEFGEHRYIKANTISMRKDVLLKFNEIFSKIINIKR